MFKWNFNFEGIEVYVTLSRYEYVGADVCFVDQSLQTGKVIDLMQDHDEVYAPNKKTVIDAEFIDLEKNKRS